MNRRFTWSRLFAVGILLTAAVPAVALDIHFSGFGTASLSCFSSDTADFVVNDQPKGPGRSRRCDGGIDSLLGVQLDLELNESVEFGLQLVVDRNEDRSHTPDVTVAQLCWRPTNALTVRLGRMPSDAFLVAETRQVRYAMPWVRPPLEVYGLVPIFSRDGLEILYKGHLGRWHAEWRGGIIRIDFDSPISNSRDTFPVEAYGPFLNLSLLDRNTLFRLGYAFSKTSGKVSQSEALFGALRLVLPDGSPVFPGGAQLAYHG